MIGRQAVLSAVGLAALGLVTVAMTGGQKGHAQSLEHDKTLPIEISADSLEVAQEQQLATFEGNVDAVQGELVLSAQTLKVRYEGTENAGGLAAGSGSSINQIEAVGDVIVTSPAETAEGDVGVYDVPAQMITLTGDVVLTRGENIIRGEQLELDLATGQSRMVGTNESKIADGGAQPGRVKALFTPRQKDETEASSGDEQQLPIPKARPN